MTTNIRPGTRVTSTKRSAICKRGSNEVFHENDAIEMNGMPPEDKSLNEEKALVPDSNRTCHELNRLPYST